MVTTMEAALGGESESRYWQKRSLISVVFDRARYFLGLKVHNSVRIVFKLDLEGELAKKYALPSPAVIRMRVSRVGLSGKEIRCEWRIASADKEISEANVDFDRISHCCFGGKENQAAWAFLVDQFGVSVPPYSYHLPEVKRIQVSMILREPLGVLAVLEGDSERVIYDPEHNYIDATRCLTYRKDDAALLEP